MSARKQGPHVLECVGAYRRSDLKFYAIITSMRLKIMHGEWSVLAIAHNIPWATEMMAFASKAPVRDISDAAVTLTSVVV